MLLGVWHSEVSGLVCPADQSAPCLHSKSSYIPDSYCTLHSNAQCTYSNPEEMMSYISVVPSGRSRIITSPGMESQRFVNTLVDEQKIKQKLFS